MRDLTPVVQLRALRGQSGLSGPELAALLRGEAVLTPLPEQRQFLQTALHFARERRRATQLGLAGLGGPPRLPALSPLLRVPSPVNTEVQLPPGLWPHAAALDLGAWAVHSLIPAAQDERSEATDHLKLWSEWISSLCSPGDPGDAMNLLEHLGYDLKDAGNVALIAFPHISLKWLEGEPAMNLQDRQKRRAIQLMIGQEPTMGTLLSFAGRPEQALDWTPPDPSLSPEGLRPSLEALHAQPAAPGRTLRERLMGTPVPPLPRNHTFTARATLAAALLCRADGDAPALLKEGLSTSPQFTQAALDVINVARGLNAAVGAHYRALASMLVRDQTLKERLLGSRA